MSKESSWLVSAYNRVANSQTCSQSNEGKCSVFTEQLRQQINILAFVEPLQYVRLSSWLTMTKEEYFSSSITISFTSIGTITRISSDSSSHDYSLFPRDRLNGMRSNHLREPILKAGRRPIAVLINSENPWDLAKQFKSTYLEVWVEYRLSQF